MKWMMTVRTQPDAHERILAAAYELFSQRGVRDVGVDELIARSGVANATFYRHFPSKELLVLAFLERREQVWTAGTIASKALARDGSTRDQLLAVFDLFDEWFHRGDYAGDPFVNILLEMGPEHSLGRASIMYLSNERDTIRKHAEHAGLEDPEGLARSLQILMKGAIVGARMGDREAAHCAKEMAGWLIDHSERVSSD
ncbi:MAG: TetR family transcriptional regulator [Microbacteriaceae bacterium]|nr:TetR family transcriptional regulator [Microbacteriaceae bacterium]